MSEEKAAEVYRRDLTDLLYEWQRTCRAMGIPFVLGEAVSFAVEADYFKHLADEMTAIREREQRVLAFATDWVKRDLAEWYDRPRRCDVTADSGYGRCKGDVIGLRWEDGFHDWVCEHHAVSAEARGALVVRAALVGETR